MNRFDRNSLEDSIANSLTNAINIMGFNPETVAERLKFQHRALQEDFTRICMEWLKVVASPDYPYDARNECSHLAAKQMLHPTKYVVITTYSFDKDVTTTIFDSEYEAFRHLRDDFEMECNIQKNENKKDIVETHNFDEGWATLKTPDIEGDFTTMEWRIVEIAL